MSCSDSSPTNTTTTNTYASETNTNTSGNSGITVAGSKGTTVGIDSHNDSHNLTNYSSTSISTDQGAVLAGSELGKLAIAANSGLSETIASGANTFGEHALDVISKSQVDSASLVSKYLAQGGALLTQQESDLASVNSQSMNQLGNFAATLATIGQANSESASAQNNALQTKTLEIGAVVLLGVLAIIFVSGAYVRR